MNQSHTEGQGLIIGLLLFLLLIGCGIYFGVKRVKHGVGDTNMPTTTPETMGSPTTPPPTSTITPNQSAKSATAKTMTYDIKTTHEGTGAVAKKGDTLSMNYTGRLENGTVFDSNVDPKFHHVQPFEFSLGAGQVIRGWDEGLVGMKVGEKRTLTISPEYGYGASGAGGVIPPNATLVFDVELLGIK